MDRMAKLKAKASVGAEETINVEREVVRATVIKMRPYQPGALADRGNLIMVCANIVTLISGIIWSQICRHYCHYRIHFNSYPTSARALVYLC